MDESLGPEGKSRYNAHQINLTVERLRVFISGAKMSVLNIYVTAVPGMAPMGVNVTRTSATVMVVSWIPLSYSEARGFISHYTVSFSPLTTGRKRQSATMSVPGMDANNTVIQDLDPNVEYIVQVSATNGAGTIQSSATTRVPLFVKGKRMQGVAKNGKGGGGGRSN